MREYSQTQEKVTVLSEKRLLDTTLPDGGWKVTLEKGKALNAVSFILSGKFSIFGNGDTLPKLLVTTADYSPEKDGLTGDSIIFKVDGELYDKDYDPQHPVWRF